MLPQFSQGFADEAHEPFRLAGNASGALLIHGFPGSPAEVRPLGQALNALGLAVRAPLLPGFGQDIESLPHRTHEDWLRCVADAYQALRSECDQTFLIGFSMGGSLALQTAERYGADALILLAPFWQINHMLWRAMPVLKYVIPRFKPFRLFKPDFKDPEVRAGIHNFLPEADLDDPEIQRSILDFEIPVKIIDEVRLLGQRGYRLAPRVKHPTLVIQGTNDELVQPALTKQLVERLAGPVQYISVTAAHDLLDDQRPAWDEIVRAVTGFIEAHRMGERS